VVVLWSGVAEAQWDKLRFWGSLCAHCRNTRSCFPSKSMHCICGIVNVAGPWLEKT